MSSAQKYKVRDFAKDFEITPKAVTEILTKYTEAPKSNMQALTDEELNILFNVLTLENQVESFEALMSDVYKEEVKEAPAPEKKAEKAPKEEKKAPEETPKPQKKAEKKEEPVADGAAAVTTKKGVQTHVIDTRGGSVDLSKYDDRVDNLVPDNVRDMGAMKQKIKKSPDRKQQNFGSKRRQEEQEKMKKLEAQVQKKPQLTVMIPDEISVGELASRMKRTGADVVKQLIKLGVMASVSDVIDYDTAAIVALEMGAKVEKEIIVTIEDRLIDESEDREEDLVGRDPVVVVMGHVDHGKTSLLDAVRKTNVASGEAGGITQHIGAYRVDINGRKLTFLDTPGHEAFTSMRARGAQVTDVVILVVAADDGIMPQTIEAINHAKAAGVPIVVAINKMDAEGANPDRIKQQLTEHELVAEEWGGNTVVCPISAKYGDGIDELLEMVILTADMLELKANPNRSAKGTVVEAKLDRGRGPVATLLVSNGTLNSGDVVIAGTSVGRIRAMTDDKGRKIKTAGPSVPVEIIGLSEVPNAGDIFYAVDDERMARELVEQRKQTEKDELNKASAKKVSLEDLFDQIQQGEIKELPIIVKADVKGSAEAVKASLEKLSNDEVRVRVIHAGVGGINESDILLASASNAIVVGFNVRPDSGARDSAAVNGTDIRLYRIIYDCIEEIEAAMKGLLAPTFREEVLGHAEIRQTFKVSKVGTIAGCHVTDGKITRSASVRVLRDNIVIFEGALASLKRFKDDAKEVSSGYECGLSVENYNDIKEGDVIEAYTMIEEKA